MGASRSERRLRPSFSIEQTGLCEITLEGLGGIIVMFIALFIGANEVSLKKAPKLFLILFPFEFFGPTVAIESECQVLICK